MTIFQIYAMLIAKQMMKNQKKGVLGMKKLCLLLSLFLLLCGCGKNSDSTHLNTPVTETVSVSDDQLVTFDVYAINDLHGKFQDTAAQPGVDELSAYLRQARQIDNTILLATGDMWQGTSESNLTGGLLITEWLNEMDCVAMTMGGHEYDWGEEQIRKNRDAAQFPFLGINVYSRETNKQTDYCQSSVIVEFDGAQIGIIGAIGDCYGSIAAENTKDVYFITGDALTALVQAESEKLRSQGADFIIYAIHDGYDQNFDGVNPIDVEHLSYCDTVLSDGYVDLVFEADSHYTYVLKDQYGVYHLQAGGNNSGISHARVLLDLGRGDAYVFTAEHIPNSKYSFLEDDPVVDHLLEKYAEQIAPATRILGINRTYKSGKNICQLVADLYCRKGVEKWGQTYDIVLGGGYISCRSPGYLPAGEVTYSQLHSLLPFDNEITLCSIKGRDLLDKFLETDHHAYYITTTAYGKTIRDSVDPNATYYVVTDSYSADYTYNNMTVIETYSADRFARDLLADYIAEGGLA